MKFLHNAFSLFSRSTETIFTSYSYWKYFIHQNV